MVAANGFRFDRLGVRVPTVAVSPWAPRGAIIGAALPGEQPTPTSAFDATSVLATSNILLGLTAEGAAPLGDRMAWCVMGFSSNLQYFRLVCGFAILWLSPAPFAICIHVFFVHVFVDSVMRASLTCSGPIRLLAYLMCSQSPEPTAQPLCRLCRALPGQPRSGATRCAGSAPSR